MKKLQNKFVNCVVLGEKGSASPWSGFWVLEEENHARGQNREREPLLFFLWCVALAKSRDVSFISRKLEKFVDFSDLPSNPSAENN